MAAMALSDCELCWNTPCDCEDGNGWMGFSVAHLESIASSIHAAIRRKRAGELEGDGGNETDPAE